MADTPLTVTVGAVALAGYAPAVKRDYTIRPGVAALAGTGYTPRLFPEGQTAEPAETTRRYSPRAPYGGAVTCMTMTQTLALYDLVKNCQKGFGFVPGGVTVIAFMVQSADLDSGTPALVQSILLGSTALVTGLTNGQGGTKGIYPCIPTEVTTPTAVYLKTTTAPATAVSGSVTITPIYYS